MSDSPTHEITQWLTDWSNGDRSALEKLTPLVYRELHRLAQAYMRGERAGHALQTTALVNEAYLRLIEADAELTGGLFFLLDICLYMSDVQQVIWADKFGPTRSPGVIPRNNVSAVRLPAVPQSGSRRKRVLSPFLRDILFTSERKG